MTIGVAIIVQNDVSHMPIGLSQFYHVADDIVVVDGGSIDDTPNVARRFGARVFFRPFDNDFSAQKNYALSLLNTEWVYVHEPDERLEPTAVSILQGLTSEVGQRALMERGIIPSSNEAFDCFGFARKNFIDGVQLDLYPEYQYRLFRNYCRFEGKINEQVMGYRNRTEVDFKRPGGNGIETLILDFPQTLDVEDNGKVSRFNILRYRSRKIQEQQDELYRLISERG